MIEFQWFFLYFDDMAFWLLSLFSFQNVSSGNLFESIVIQTL